ncbi:glutamate receptor 3-like isoform X3 [Polistes fuscatus]|uniref:glutamate receptor 3-like isoform X3 n=1 Tax=Polistes fuscatus TaxID=30207 RepID=UPI001CA9FF11|nr:glutamate receptor 3-like isoform X3 [Polistes fuscatus]
MKLMIAEEELTSNVLEAFKKIYQNMKLALYSSAEVHKTVDLKIFCNVVSIKAGRVDCLSQILTKHNQFTNLIKFLFNSEMLVRCGTENILREWYSLDTNRTDIDYFATWNSDEGIVQKVSGSLYERRKDLQGSIIRVILVKESCFANLNEDNELDGIFGILFKELSAALNFSYIVSEIDGYGIWNKNENSWSKALNEIVSGRADISLADFSLTSDRLNHFDFSLPIILGENNLYFREPEAFLIKWSSYFRIFSYFIWISIIGILIAASILLVFLKIKNGNDRKIRLLLSDTFIEVLGIFCQQGLADFPDSYSLRIAYFSIFILAVVLSAAYSAILICFLTSTIHTVPFRSLQAFADDGTYKISFFRDSTKYHSFASSENPLAKKIMKLMIEREKLPINLMDGFREICDNHKLTIYTYYDMKRDMFIKMPCNVNYIKTGMLENLAFTLSKDYPFTDVINAQNGNDNDGFQMDACTITRRFYHLEFVFFGVTRIVLLRGTNS